MFVCLVVTHEVDFRSLIFIFSDTWETNTKTSTKATNLIINDSGTVPGKTQKKRDKNLTKRNDEWKTCLVDSET